MAAGANFKLRTWCEESPQTFVKTTYRDHLKGLPTKEIVARSGIVLANAGNGAWMGAVVGVALPAPGASAIGALIGAAIGGLTSGTCMAAADNADFQEQISQYPVEGMQALNQIIMEEGWEVDDLCGIEYVVPLTPVRLQQQRQIYGYEVARNWVQNHSRNPQTNAPALTSEIEPAHDAIARIGKLCDRVLHTPHLAARLTPAQRDGIAWVRKVNKEHAMARYKTERAIIRALYDAGKINEIEEEERITIARQELHPSLGHEGDDVQYERVPRNMKPTQAGAAQFRYVEEKKE